MGVGVLRRRTTPEVVTSVALDRGERRVAWALTTGGEAVIATDRALHLPGGGQRVRDPPLPGLQGHGPDDLGRRTPAQQPHATTLGAAPKIRCVRRQRAAASLRRTQPIKVAAKLRLPAGA